MDNQPDKAKDEYIEEVHRMVEAHDIKFVHLQFMDILGTPKSVTIPVNLLDTAIDEGVQFDGSSIMGYATIEESDMMARPVPSTFKPLPQTLNGSASARMICNIYTSNGKRFNGDPRYILERAMERAGRKGWIPHIGPEIEFFLFRFDEHGNPAPILHDHSGYFDFGAHDYAEDVKKEMVEYMEAMGYRVEALHHEVAPSQHEIDMRYSDAMTMADAFSTLKMGIKSIARNHGLYATFMPKPIYGVCGNGMHIHQSLLTKERENVFYDPDARWQVHERLLHYIGGLMKYARESCAIMNSWVNSYKRLVPGYEAPIYITWANLNRSVLIRVPAGRGRGTRCELRNPDPAGNPYLQFATMIQCGLEGIEKKIEPPEPLENVNVYKLTAEDLKKKKIELLPDNLSSALDELEHSNFMKRVLGPVVHENFIHIKKMEWSEYRSQITSWEIETLLPRL